MNFNIVLTAVGILTAVSAGLSIIISVADKVLNNYGICELDINDGEKKLSVTGGSSLLNLLAGEKIFIPPPAAARPPAACARCPCWKAAVRCC